MTFNVNLEIVSFGEIKFEIGRPVSFGEEPMPVPAQKSIYYREPEVTALPAYEEWYIEGRNDYIIPTTTG